MVKAASDVISSLNASLQQLQSAEKKASVLLDLVELFSGLI
jgi:hypothetical protein